MFNLMNTTSFILVIITINLEYFEDHVSDLSVTIKL